MHELRGEGAATRADLHDEIPGAGSRGVDDALDRRTVGQEVLAERRMSTRRDPSIAACYTCPARPSWGAVSRRVLHGGAGGPSVAVAKDRILLLNDDTFDREIQGRAEPILVDFQASWCAPCKVIEPWLEELAEDLDGRAVVARVDIDDSGDLANRFGILSVPTLLVFRAGRIADRLVGAAPREEIRRLLLRHVGRTADPV
jgi:thioredoxin 1